MYPEEREMIQRWGLHVHLYRMLRCVHHDIVDRLHTSLHHMTSAADVSNALRYAPCRLNVFGLQMTNAIVLMHILTRYMYSFILPRLVSA